MRFVSRMSASSSESTTIYSMSSICETIFLVRTEWCLDF